ncbi:helix-turn-helix domain-containing protein [Isoptericola aurantiacus]|uniref:helix-turn-helix domain-containing protein n=1 Tax=Isoptericola aurantiacus TaxID=3377839 RepID=UPI00383B792E
MAAAWSTRARLKRSRSARCARCRTKPSSSTSPSAPRPCAGVRATDRREDIVRLARQGLSCRAIADQVGLGKSAVNKLLQAEGPLTA